MVERCGHKTMKDVTAELEIVSLLLVPKLAKFKVRVGMSSQAADKPLMAV